MNLKIAYKEQKSFSYGNRFLLTITISNPKQNVGELLNHSVMQEFQAMPSREPLHMSTITWEIPRRPEATWSQLYRQAMQFVSRFPVVEQQFPEISQELPIIQDFSLVQSSLEQVFVSMSRFSPEEDYI